MKKNNIILRIKACYVETPVKMWRKNAFWLIWKYFVKFFHLLKKIDKRKKCPEKKASGKEKNIERRLPFRKSRNRNCALCLVDALKDREIFRQVPSVWHIQTFYYRQALKRFRECFRTDFRLSFGGDLRRKYLRNLRVWVRLFCFLYSVKNIETKSAHTASRRRTVE